MIQISQKKKYSILSENKELELTPNGDFIIKKSWLKITKLLIFIVIHMKDFFSYSRLFCKKRKLICINH